MALLGAIAGVVISITNRSISVITGGFSSATVGYRLNSNGNVERNQQGSYSTIEQWCTPASQASNYEARATIVSGSPSGTFGSWLALSSSREWTLFAAQNNFETAQITVEIRQTGTTTVLDSATITLTADALP